jgi:hypothetical protein
VLLAGSASAREAADGPGTIVVQGIGTIETPPEIATISFAVRGEGGTADAATQALVDRQKAILDGLVRLTNGRIEVETDTVELGAARAGDCRIDGYDSTPARSTGDCAIIGYVATLETKVRMTTVAEAGTAVGLAGRLGAERSSISSYGLGDDASVRRRARRGRAGGRQGTGRGDRRRGRRTVGPNPFGARLERITCGRRHRRHRNAGAAATAAASRGADRGGPETQPDRDSRAPGGDIRHR